jgi:precorrin-3B methylase
VYISNCNSKNKKKKLEANCTSITANKKPQDTSIMLQVNLYREENVTYIFPLQSNTPLPNILKTDAYLQGNSVYFLYEDQSLNNVQDNVFLI